jgi:uncharacterized protein
MDERTAEEAIRFVRSIAEETNAKDVSIVFHGGEPLLAPQRIWEVLFLEIKKHLAGYNVELSLQSNLWNLNDDLLRLLRENSVSIGTSIDGPRDVCDMNRGTGYFDNTFSVLQDTIKEVHTVSAIATITKQTMPYKEEIVKFFRDLGMPIVLHGASAPMDKKGSPYALTAEEYSRLIMELFPWYVKNRKLIRIDTLDHFVRGIVNGDPCVCTFKDCFGMFLSISPGGDITSCQRLAGHPDHCIGNIFDRPTLAGLYENAVARKIQARETEVAERCGECGFYSICKGGCYYNAVASGDGTIDPWCTAYKEIFSFVQSNIMEEMQSRENIEAVVSDPYGYGRHPLFRKGKYLSLAENTHPAFVADNSRRILSIHELGRTNDPHAAAIVLNKQHICGDVRITEDMLTRIREDLKHPTSNLNNCYAHVTFDCNLRCSHCYAKGGDSNEEMAKDDFERLLKEAVDAGFRQIVVTGGEPMVHTHRSDILEACRRYRGKWTNIVLRTNLTGNFDERMLSAIAGSVDQIVVSVDGDEHTHDARRGAGTYKNMVSNLERYVEIAGSVPDHAELSLACVMHSEDINGEPGNNVRVLGDRLNIGRIRFRPLLPLGRSADSDEPLACEGLMQHLSSEDMLKTGFRPMVTCGIGQNLFVSPDGKAYPCYAWCRPHTCMGDVFENGLEKILSSSKFMEMSGCTVDTTEKCMECEYRYLCGGACRAWGRTSDTDLNSAPIKCDHLKKRAQGLIDAAKEYILN